MSVLACPAKALCSPCPTCHESRRSKGRRRQDKPHKQYTLKEGSVRCLVPLSAAWLVRRAGGEAALREQSPQPRQWLPKRSQKCIRHPSLLNPTAEQNRPSRLAAGRPHTLCNPKSRCTLSPCARCSYSSPFSGQKQKFRASRTSRYCAVRSPRSTRWTTAQPFLVQLSPSQHATCRPRLLRGRAMTRVKVDSPSWFRALLK